MKRRKNGSGKGRIHHAYLVDPRYQDRMTRRYRVTWCPCFVIGVAT